MCEVNHDGITTPLNIFQMMIEVNAIYINIYLIIYIANYSVVKSLQSNYEILYFLLPEIDVTCPSSCACLAKLSVKLTSTGAEPVDDRVRSSYISNFMSIELLIHAP